MIELGWYGSDLALRSSAGELLDAADVSEDDLARAYRELGWVNRWLGNTDAIVRLLRADSKAGRILRVLDVGCGRGALLVEIQKRLRADVVGIDLLDAALDTPVPILSGNAVTDSLPVVDVAVCALVAHHLSEIELAGMIGNVSRSSRRLIVLDLVRHPVPLWLFGVFVRPWLCRINASDGETSIRRAYSAKEMREVVDRALTTIQRRTLSVRHTVAPLWIRQVIDIRWE